MYFELHIKGASLSKVPKQTSSVVDGHEPALLLGWQRFRDEVTRSGTAQVHLEFRPLTHEFQCS